MPLSPPRKSTTNQPDLDSQEALYAQQRALGNIDPIPFDKRTKADHQAYLPIILAEIAAYNRIDDPKVTVQGCIAPGDMAFGILMKKLNDTRAALGMPPVPASEVQHQPWCAPQTLGTGPRR